MKKLSLITAVLLLSCAWAVAQTSPSTTDSSQNPSSTQPSTPSPTAQQPDTSAASSTGNEKGNAIEGCLNGSAGSFTLTDAAGTKYQLAGDTSKLSDHVGHEVKVWGDTSSASASATTGSTTSTATSEPTLTVKRVKMVSSTCSNK